MNPVDVKFVRLLSTRCEKFTTKKTDLYQLRCPYCGDSQKHKNKARGYFFGKQQRLFYRCHNCGIGRSLSSFLQEIAPDLYGPYNLESFSGRKSYTKSQVTLEESVFAKPVFKVSPGKELPTIDRLDFEHPARKYLESRMIPDLSKFYYTDNFKRWVNSVTPKFNSLDHDDARIIIPLLDEEGEWMGFQGRSLDPKATLRYITIMLNEEDPKLYGLDTIRTEDAVFITEGPFDSTFIRNACAMCGSDVHLGDCGIRNPVWVYDNEPRNQQIIDRISRTISNGNSVVIWPKDIKEKDINDMVLAGHDVQNIVDSNIHAGLQAQVKLNDWKKV